MYNKYPYNAIITVTALSPCLSGPSSHSKMLVYVRHREDLELKYWQIPCVNLLEINHRKCVRLHILIQVSRSKLCDNMLTKFLP